MWRFPYVHVLLRRFPKTIDDVYVIFHILGMLSLKTTKYMFCWQIKSLISNNVNEGITMLMKELEIE